MNTIVRAWKDEAYRLGLSAEEQAMLPANPAGEIELTDTELEAVSGGCNLHKAEPTIKVKQDIDQKVVGSFSGTGGVAIVNSTLTCNVTATATNAAAVTPATTTGGYDTDYDTGYNTSYGGESFKCWW